MVTNEFVAKKLGEVLAFAKIGEEVFERGRRALEEVFTEKGINEMLHSVSEHRVAIENLAQDMGTTDITIPKSEKTADKLREMLRLYVGEKWDNPTELLEWHGFFEGAAIIHWKLVQGAAEALDHVRLKELAKTGLEFHENFLSEVSKQIKNVGAKKAL